MTQPGNANLPIGNENNLPQEANQEIGDPRPAWLSRGYLPHVESTELVQHVTFHLEDSLPKSVIERLNADLKSLRIAKQDIERRKRIEAWLDAGHGSCVLRDPGIAAMTQNSFLHFDGQRYRLLDWVVMPNHVHILFQPINPWTVAKIVASWKKFTARKICDHRKAGIPGNANLPIGSTTKSKPPANQEIGVPSVWHREYWDRYIRDERHLKMAMDYIHTNPVKAGLVSKPEEWQWSSAYALSTEN